MEVDICPYQVALASTTFTNLTCTLEFLNVIVDEFSMPLTLTVLLAVPQQPQCNYSLFVTDKALLALINC